MTTRRFPYLYYTLPVLPLALAGVCASIYLAVSHYRNYTDIVYSSFCALSQSVNCDTVAQSSYSILIEVPLSVWGIFAYLLFFIIAIPAQTDSSQRRCLWDVLFIIAAIYSTAGVYFAYLASIKIKAYCLVCIFTYFVNFGLLFSVFIIRRRFLTHSLFSGIRQSLTAVKESKIYSSITLLFFAALLSLVLFFPRYWDYQYPAISDAVHKGTLETGEPWIGAEEPMIIIHEFADYQCFQCRKMHYYLRLLIEKSSDKIRLIHHHYPLDKRYNTLLLSEKTYTGSGEMALMAIASARQGKFWQANDLLFTIAGYGLKELNVTTFANRLSLDVSKFRGDFSSIESLKKLETDIKTGLKFKIHGTPSFVIDGEVYSGTLPVSLLHAMQTK